MSTSRMPKKGRTMGEKRETRLNDEFAVTESDGVLTSADGRRWVIEGDPAEDWWMEIDASGKKLPGGWEWDREAGTVICSCL